MPKTRAYGAAQQAAVAESQRVERIQLILRCAALQKGYENIKDLAAAIGINYSTLAARIRKGDMSMRQFTELADFLRLDGQARAACCGSREKCGLEDGRKAAS